MALLARRPADRRRLRGRPARRPVRDLLLLRPGPAPPLPGHLERPQPHPRRRQPPPASPLPRLLRRRLPLHGLQRPLRPQRASRHRRQVAAVSRVTTNFFGNKRPPPGSFFWNGGGE